MRRATNLFEGIADLENLRLAFHKAARGRRGQSVVRQFAAGLDRRMAAMSEAIRAGTFQVGRFQQFLIRDPKERVITAPCFDERVLHHAITGPGACGAAGITERVQPAAAADIPDRIFPRGRREELEIPSRCGTTTVGGWS